MRCSLGVNELYRMLCWGQRPMNFEAELKSVRMSWPKTHAVPDEGFTIPDSMLLKSKCFALVYYLKMSGSVITYMVVDFPAPLWPNKAVTSPRRNSMVRSLTAVLVKPLDSRKTLVKFSRRTPSKLWECIDGPLDSDAFSLGDGWETELRCVDPTRLFHSRWR